MTDIKKIPSQIRRDIVRMVNGCASGHPGGSLGSVEYFTALYFSVMKNNPENFTMDGKNEDLFFLSNGHISPVLYSTLARRGYFPVKELSTFRKLNTRLQGHPSVAKKLPGVRMASGSLGQGLSVAIGAAETKKLNKENNFVFSLHGDGELQEGQIWEAAMYASAKKVDNLIAAIDYNKQQIDGPVSEVIDLGNLNQKFTAFGWEVLEVEDGNDLDQVIDSLNLAKSKCGKGKPVVLLLHTVMGKGVDYMENNHGWHGVAPNDEQLKSALSQIEETIGDY